MLVYAIRWVKSTGGADGIFKSAYDASTGQALTNLTLIALLEANFIERSQG
jgi:hypothetical protein